MSDAQHTDALIQWCACPEGPYLGAQKLGTPPRCERCGFLPDLPWVHATLLDALTRHGVLTEEDWTPGRRRLVTRWEPTP